MSQGKKRNKLHDRPLQTTEKGPRPNWESRQLLICHASGTRSLPLRDGGSFVIGRDEPSDYVIHEPRLSKTHARITVAKSAVTIVDLGSTNGVWLGDERVESATLTTGNDVALGAEVVLRLVHGISRGEQVSSRDAFDILLKQEAARARSSGDALAVVMLTPDTGFTAPATSLAGTVRKCLGPLDQISCHSTRVLQILVVGRNATRHKEICEKLVASIPGHTVFVGMANLHDSPTSALGLLELALRRLRAATEDCALVLSGYEDSTDSMIAESPAMKKVVELIESVAPVTLPVLIHGETGTGKEVVAAEIHRRGPRSRGPLRTLNCGAIPSQLAESLLFGHKKGAFTGADETRAGLFEQADGGTVLLDEIGELPLALQAKLLRVLETKRVSRVGSHDEIAFDARLIAATHCDLEAMCDEGTFRRDLFYRLNGIQIFLPPLREREEDIGRLTERFLTMAAEQNGVERLPFGAEAMQCLRTYAWPGNVRELRNVIERAVVVARGTCVTPDDLPSALADGTKPPAQRKMPTTESEGTSSGLDEQIATFEGELLLAALAASKGNKSRAAVLLEMPRRTCATKIRELQVEDRREEGEQAGESVIKILGSIGFKAAVAELERTLLGEALAQCDNNRAAAARRLKVPTHVVAYMAKKYSL